MVSLWAWVVATAVLSSLLTVGLAVLVFRRLAKRIEERVEHRLEASLAKTAVEVGDAMEQRLRRVVGDAVREFRSASLAAGATRTAAATGAELLQEGLRLLMGGPPKP
jgi:hypothetical protein